MRHAHNLMIGNLNGSLPQSKYRLFLSRICCISTVRGRFSSRRQNCLCARLFPEPCKLHSEPAKTSYSHQIYDYIMKIIYIDYIVYLMGYITCLFLPLTLVKAYLSLYLYFNSFHHSCCFYLQRRLGLTFLCGLSLSRFITPIAYIPFSEVSKMFHVKQMTKEQTMNACSFAGCGV